MTARPEDGEDAVAQPPRPTPPEPITRLSAVRSEYNVVSAVDGAGTARDMIIHLERLGIAPDHISLLGAQPRDDVDESPPAGVVRTFALGTSIGAVAGGAIGAALGVVAGLVFPVFGTAATAAVLAVVGAVAGVIVATTATMSGSDAWNDTFAAEQVGNVVVGVHTRDQAEADRAYELMSDLEPLAINRF
jgi:hypothetical protein